MELTNGRPRLAAVTLLFLAFCLVAAWPSFAGEGSPRKGGTLRISDSNEGTAIGYPPKMSKTLFAFREAAPAIETLLRLDKSGKVVPWLATAVKEDPKAKAITLTLRTGVKFHDGTEFNAEAVKWNLERQTAEKTVGTEKLQSIEALDARTVRLTLSTWDSTIVGSLTQYLGMMVSPTAYAKNGEQWCLTHPVGTGPFQFVSWEKDVRVVYDKFPGYWQQGKPYLDKIEFAPNPDYQTRQFSLKNGEIDVALRIATKDVDAMSRAGYQMVRGKGGSGAVSVIPDSRNESSPFSNLKVRQAVAHAIDTAAIATSIFHGQVESTNQEAYKGHWGYNPSVVGYPYNPAKARQLLAEAGYPKGFKTKLLHLSGQQEYDAVFTAIQGYLRAVGIEAELDPAQTGRYMQAAWKQGKWEGLIMAQPSGNPDVAVPLESWYAGTGTAYGQMAAPAEVTKAIQEAVAAPDSKTKQKNVWQAMKLLIDKHSLVIPLYCMPDFVASNASVRSHGIYETPNIGAWTPEAVWLDAKKK